MQEKLNQFHIILFTYMAQSGVVMFRLPRIVAENFGTNGWISILVCFVISSFNILLIHFVYKHGQGQSVFQLLEQRFPRWILYPLYVVFALLLIKVLITSILYFWVAEITLKRMMPKIKTEWIDLFLVIFSFTMAFYPQVIQDVEKALYFAGIVQLVLSFALPLLLMLVIALQRDGTRRRAAPS